MSCHIIVLNILQNLKIQCDSIVRIFICIRTYVGTRLLCHSLELVVVTCTVYLDTQVPHHLSNLDHSRCVLLPVDIYTASIGLCHCYM